MRSTFKRYDPCVTGHDCTLKCEGCMVSLISDRFLGERFTKDVLSKKFSRTRNMFTYVLIADTMGCNLDCWYCYAWKYLDAKSTRQLSTAYIAPRELARQFSCKIESTADLENMKNMCRDKSYMSPDDQRKCLKHLDLGLPFSRIRVSGGEPLFSNADVLRDEGTTDDPIDATMQYWLEFFTEFDGLVGDLIANGTINVAMQDSDWHLLPHPVWLTEAAGRIMVRFDTNGLVFHDRDYTDRFYSELCKLYKEGGLDNLHIQIDYSFKGTTKNEFLWSQSKALPSTEENNETLIDLSNHPQVPGLQNISSAIERHSEEAPGFGDCVSVTVERGIDHDGKKHLWLYHQGSLDWESFEKKLGIPFSDVINRFDLLGWQTRSKLYRYARRGATVRLSAGGEAVDLATDGLASIERFLYAHSKDDDFMAVTIPTGDRIHLGKPARAARELPDVKPSTDQEYWIITGSWANMKLGTEQGLWGVGTKFKELWDVVKEGDLVFFYCTRPISGLVGHGSVTGKEPDDTPFWPNENRQRPSRYPLRIKFEQCQLFNNWFEKRRPLPKSTGIEYYGGLNYVPLEKRPILRKLLDLDE